MLSCIRIESEHLSKGKVDAGAASQRMLPILERTDTVINESSGTAPHHDVTAFEAHTLYRIRATFATPEEYGRQAKRNRDDRSPGILLVAVLVKAQFGARAIAIDQASVGILVQEPGLRSGTGSDVEECHGHCRPGNASVGIHGIVAVAGPVGYPTDTTAVGHRDRHCVTAGRH